MSAVIGLQLSEWEIDRHTAWRKAAPQVNQALEIQQAIENVKPYGDHLGRWLAEEVSKHPLPDREWINGVLKGAIADQNPYLPMVWLDDRLPSGEIKE